MDNEKKKVNGFKSMAQMERCMNMVKEGKMTQEQFDEYHNATNYVDLPNRIHPKKEDKK